MPGHYLSHSVFTLFPVRICPQKQSQIIFFDLFQKKSIKNFAGSKITLNFASQLRNDSVAQLVEQMTLNHWVESSSLSGVTKAEAYASAFFMYDGLHR